MKRNLIETVMGAVVLLVAAFFIITAYKSSGIRKETGYTIAAVFDNVNGITTGSDVKIGGIKIGTVLDQVLDTETFQVKVLLGIRDDIKLSADTSARIASESLMGGKYIDLLPGSDDNILKEGDNIEFSQGSVDIESLIGRFAFGGSDEEKDKSAQ